MTRKGVRRTRKTNLLLTAFEPFGGQTLNPSLEAMRAIAKRRFTGARIEVLELPVHRFRAIDIALTRIRRRPPDALVSDVVVMLGEGRRRFRVTPERVAINVDDFPIPDNQGHQPQGEPIIEDGPVGYFSTLLIYEMVDQLRKAHIPAAISNSAGTYLCNRLFYSVLHCIATEGLPIKAGFVHLPCLHEQVVDSYLDVPSLSRETIQEAVRIVIEVSLQGVEA